MVPGETESISLKSSTLKNLGVVTVAQLTALAITQLALLLLAHILTPSDFGVYAIVVVVYNIAMITATAGLDQAAVQSKEEEEIVLSTGVFLRGVVTASVVAVLVMLAPLMSDFFDNPRLTFPLRVTSIAVAASFLSIYPFVRLNRQLRFTQLSIGRIAYATIWPAIAVASALAGADYWSLVMALVGANLALSLTLLYFEPWKPTLRVDLGVGKRLLRYGNYAMLAAVVSILLINLDKVVIGRMLSEAMLGAYYLAFTWGMAVPNLFTNIANSVMFPTYSQISCDRCLLKRAYEKTFAYLAYVSMPIGIGLATVSSVFVGGVLGPEWTEAVAPLAIISIVGLLYSLTSPAIIVFLATGHPELQLKQSVIMFVPFILLIVPSVIYLELVGASLVLLMVSAISFAWVLRVTSKLLSDEPFSVLPSMKKPAISSLAMGGIVLLASLVVPVSAVGFLILVTLGIVSYLAFTQFITNGEAMKEARAMMRTILAKRR